MKAKRKVLPFYPVTVASGVFMDGTKKNLKEIIENGEALSKNINNSPLVVSKVRGDIVEKADIKTTKWHCVDGEIKESFIIDKLNNNDELFAIEFKSTNNGRLTYSFSNPVDGDKYPLLLQLYMEENEDITNMLTTKIELYSDNNLTADYRGIITLQYAEGNTEYTKDFSRQGLFCICQLPSQLISSKGTNFNINNITGIGFHVLHTPGSTRTIKISNVSFMKPLLNGGCVTIVDNFNINVPKMCDYAYEKGVKLNVSIIPNSLEGGNDILSASKDELERIKKQGHTIINHTYNHLNFNTLTDINIIDEIVKAENWMEENNFNKGSRILSIPSARFNTKTYNIVMKSNADVIYHMWSHTNNEENLFKIIYPYYPTTRMLDTSSLDKCDEAIELCKKALKYKGIVVNGYHGTFWEKDDGVSWKKYIDAISMIEGLRHYGIDEIIENKII